jgi:iron(III) transport system ATP-binding protein
MRVAEGEVRVILGRSGSGKTTLLRAVAGFERLSAGELRLMGAPVDGGAFVPTEKRSVGLVFQDYALFPHLTVGKNVGFGMRPRDEGEVRRLLELVDLAARAGARPSELSGGEQQRVALARALAARPSVMLLDEPFSNLDPELREGLRAQTFAVLREGGHTALMVTHSAAEAMAVADRISVMHAGEVLQTGTPEELYDAPRSARVARALGAFEAVEATASGGRVECAWGVIPEVSGAPAEGRGEVAVRPEWFALSGEGVEAEVTSRRFAGDRVVLELEAPSGARARTWCAPWDAPSGGRVHVKIRRAAWLGA